MLRVMVQEAVTFYAERTKARVCHVGLIPSKRGVGLASEKLAPHLARDFDE
jgi:hypothetical protein